MLKKQPGFALKKIKDSYYLLPFGQQVADQKKGLFLNETGSFLWECLCDTTKHAELVKKLAEHYQLEESDFPMLEEDVTLFLNQLTSFDILKDDGDSADSLSSIYMNIADLVIRLCGPAELFPKEFSAFACDPKTAQKITQEIHLICQSPTKQNGTVLLRNRELSILEHADGYVMLFPTLKNIFEAHMTKDGHLVQIYCSSAVTESNLENLFHAIRPFFLFIAQKNGKFAVHSASLLYKEKAWLFSGHSGMGKSTHTNLWKELFGTPLLNGDLNLIGEENGQFFVYGIPWCGTSGICTTEKQRLGGIVLLGRDAKDNRFEIMTPSERVLRVMQRMISPSWTDELVSRSLAFAETLTDEIPVFHFLCMKNPSAAHKMRQRIDLWEAVKQ